MFESLVSLLWRKAPRRVRRLGVWLTQARFTVTAGAVVLDERGRVLLLKHRLRGGSGWGIPGGFLGRGEQPVDALRRELREEVGAEVWSASVALVRTLARTQQVEVIFKCRMESSAVAGHAPNFEIRRAEWFEPDSLPRGLGSDQRLLIERVLSSEAEGGG